MTGHKRGSPFAFLGGCLGRFGGGCGCLGCALCRRPCGLARCPGGFGILALDLLLLPEPGNGIGGRLRDLRVIPQGLLVKILRVCGKGLPLGFFCGPVGFQLVVPDAAADGPASLTLGKFFSLMAALHTHVFMLNFVDFPVGE